MFTAVKINAGPAAGVSCLSLRRALSSYGVSIVLFLVASSALLWSRHGLSRNVLPLNEIREILSLSSQKQNMLAIGTTVAYPGGPSYYVVTNHPKHDYVSGIVVDSGVFEREITLYVKSVMERAIKRYGAKAVVVVDVGANIGSTVTLPMAAEGYNVVAFEMQPSVARRLLLALKLNKWHSTVRLFNRAVASGGSKACVGFNQAAGDAGNVGGTMGTILPLSAKGCVRGIRIDAAVGLSRRVPIMKIDIEGMELEAIKSSQELFDRGLIGEVIAEMRPGQGNVVALMKKNGFKHIHHVDGGEFPELSSRDISDFFSGNTTRLGQAPNLLFKRE
jgi:FkbM family methyltransferase